MFSWDRMSLSINNFVCKLLKTTLIFSKMNILYFKFRKVNRTLLLQNASSSGLDTNTIASITYLIGVYLSLIISILCVAFSILAICVLGYFIHKRYFLYKKMKRTVNRELPIAHDVIKKLKNMKIEAFVHNFIFFILIIEIFENFDLCVFIMNSWLNYFFRIPNGIMNKLNRLSFMAAAVAEFLGIILVPSLCVFLRMLWFIYNHHPYKDALMKWLAYIIIRFSTMFVNVAIGSTIPINTASNILCLCLQVAMLSFYVIDYVMFLKYSRQFYLHLKSREEEIRLHYYDKQAYLHSKFVRKYFGHSTTFVAISLFFLTFSYFTMAFSCTLDTIDTLIPIIPLEVWGDLFENIIFPISTCLYHISQTLYRLLIVLSYLYMFFVIVRKLYFKRIDYININDKIKPLLQHYHNNF